MAVTNYPDGFTNVLDTSTLGTYFAPDPTKAHVFFDDFDRFDANVTGAADWQANLTGTAITAAIITDSDGGNMQVTNTAGATDAAFFQWKGRNVSTDVAETFQWNATKKLWFKARFKTSDANLSSVIMGLQETDATPLDVNNGLFWIKSTGSTALQFRAEKTNTASTVSTGVMVSDTFLTVGFMWDSDLGKLNTFVNDLPTGAITVTTNMPTVTLTPSFGIQNGAAVAKVMTVDYIFIAKER